MSDLIITGVLRVWRKSPPSGWTAQLTPNPVVAVAGNPGIDIEFERQVDCIHDLVASGTFVER